jgi:hypothetical protein
MSYVKTESLLFNIIENNSKIIEFLATGGTGDYYFEIVDYPKYGKLSDKINNIVKYTPNKDYVGYDTFSYKAGDSNTTSNASNIILNIYTGIPSNHNKENYVNANIFETTVLSLEIPYKYDYYVLDNSIATPIPHSNKVLLKKTGKTKIILTNNEDSLVINLNVYFYNKNAKSYNLISPTLAYQRNAHESYKRQISEYNKILNTKFIPYTLQYYQTSYDRIFQYPDQSEVPM